MTTAQGWVVGLIFLWSLWLLRHGRMNSPRRRREQARWDYLLEKAVREELNR